MVNTIITYLQVFGIGFSFGIAGPCFLFCTPILITYILGRRERLKAALADIIVFLIGRLTAYVLLGVAAGLSGVLIRQIVQSSISRYLSPLGGVVSIVLGIFVLTYRENQNCSCGKVRRRSYGYGSLYLLGFVMGASPCGPLYALLVQIALMSKSGFEGGAYALFFGLGTLFSGVLAIGAFAGLLGGFIGRVIKSRTGNRIFRFVCALLLIIFGLWHIFRYSINAYSIF